METNEKEQIKKVAEASTEGVKEESVEQVAEKQEEVKVDKPVEEQTKEELLETIKKKEEYADECKTVAQRLQADFENYKKRNAKFGEQMKHMGQEIIMSDLISVLDNCNLAKQYVKNEKALVGFTMMEKQLRDALEKYGLKEIEVKEGDDFDPNIMNAHEKQKVEGKEGKVIQIISKGYYLNEKQARPVSVIIGE